MKRVFAHIGFSFAITLIVLNLFSIKAALVILAITGAAFAVSFALKKTRQVISVALCMFSAFLACAVFITTYYGTLLPCEKLNETTAYSEFYIVDLEQETSSGYSYTVKTVSVDKEGAPQNIRLHVKSKTRINADYYQLIKGELKFRLVAENGFNSYGAFGEKVFLTSNLNSYSTIDKTIKSPNKYILEIRQSIKGLVEDAIGGDSGSIVLALLTGDKTDVSSSVKSNFRDSGASHIMAVSGLHLAVLSGSVYWFLKKIRTPKIPRIFISLAAVLFYMALSGFSKSITRAGIMMIILLAAKLFNEKSDSLNSLGIAVFIICFNPYAVTDAGALLTVTAVLGLAVINPQIRKLYQPKTKIFRYIYEVLTASVSVFITTLPVLYLTFGYVSLLGIFLNIVMIPVAQFTLIVAFQMVIFQWFTPFLRVFAFWAKLGASAMLFITEHCAKLPFAVKDISNPVFGIVIASVFILFGIAFIFSGKKLLKQCTALSVAIAIVILAVSYALNFNCVYIRVINGYYTSAVVVYDRENAVVAGVNDSSQYTTVKNLISANNLDVMLIIDTGSSEYSEKLTSDFDVLNYVSCKKTSGSGINCSNIINADDFDVDLWQSFNVKYHYNKNNIYVALKIYNSHFEILGKYDNYNSYEHVMYLNTVSDYDIVYTVNKNGLAERRLNQWQK